MQGLSSSAAWGSQLQSAILSTRRNKRRTRLYTYIYIYIDICMYFSVCVFVHTYIYIYIIHACTYIHMRAQVFAHVCVCMCVWRVVGLTGTVQESLERSMPSAVQELGILGGPRRLSFLELGCSP